MDKLKQTKGRSTYGLGGLSLEVAPLPMSTLGKAERGYALALETLPQARKAGTSTITSEHDVDSAIAMLLASCQEHILANETIAKDGRHPEGVHQMRVALRRLRSAFSYLRRDVPAPAFELHSSEAKWITGALGLARNWDVFIDSTLAGPAKAIAPEIRLDSLREAAQTHREVSYSALRAVLAHPRYCRFQSSLGDWIARRGWRDEIEWSVSSLLSEPAVTLADRVLTRLRRKALKQGAHFQRLQPEARHELRITLKKLRYAAEAFAPLYDGEAAAKRYLASLLRLQNALGAESDVQTSRSLLHAIAQERVAAEVHRAIGALIGWQERDSIANAKKLRKSWRFFETMSPFWAK